MGYLVAGKILRYTVISVKVAESKLSFFIKNNIIYVEKYDCG